MVALIQSKSMVYSLISEMWADIFVYIYKGKGRIKYAECQTNLYSLKKIIQGYGFGIENKGEKAIKGMIYLLIRQILWIYSYFKLEELNKRFRSEGYLFCKMIST